MRGKREIKRGCLEGEDFGDTKEKTYDAESSRSKERERSNSPTREPLRRLSGRKRRAARNETMEARGDGGTE